MLTVGQALAGARRRYRDKTALIFGDYRMTFRELDDRANQIARVLRQRGVSPGERVALLMPNGLRMAEAYFGLARAGVVGVPLNLRWTPREIGYVLEDADVRLVIADPDAVPLLGGAVEAGRLAVWIAGGAGDTGWEAELARQSPDPVATEPQEGDPFVIVYTSGTTGWPKGAVRSHYSNLVIALGLCFELGISADDIGFAILPMFHVNSMWLVTLSVAIGATCVIYPRRTFHPQYVLEEIATRRVTFGGFVPSLLGYLAEAGESKKIDVGTLRVILSSSAPLDAGLRDRLLRAFPDTRLYDVYGATEYGVATIMRHRPGGPLGSVGYPVIGQEIRILDDARRPVPVGTVGEVFVRGPSVMTEYFHRPDANETNYTADGFLTVGDLGYVDDEGLLYLVDRKQDMIIVAGENVYPAEVEGVLMRHPDVASAAVVGIADPVRGQRVVAMVVGRSGRTPDPAALAAWCRQNLADYKRPVAIDVVEELPMGPAAKVVRRLARDQWMARHPDS